MSAVQDKIEENISAALEKARNRSEYDETRQLWALIAVAEALDGIRQALVRGEAGATVTSYTVTP